MKKVPKYLYLYMQERLDRIGDILVHNNLYLSSPDNFNDPFDCARGIRFPNPDKLTIEDEKDWRAYFFHLAIKQGNDAKTAEIIAEKKISEGKHKNREFCGDCETEIEKAIASHGRSLGIACLSETPSSMCMWGHYASSHRGVVIKFETQKLIDNKGELRVFSVKYSNKLPSLRDYVRSVNSDALVEFSKLFLCEVAPKNETGV